MLAAFTECAPGHVDELAEERVRAIRAGEELRVELDTKHEGVVFDFHDLDKAVVRGEAGRPESDGLESLTIRVVDLESVAVTLIDDGDAVCPPGD